MQAEIIATGSELMLGEQVDTNSSYVARRLREIGLPLVYVTLVGDDEPRMADVIRIALSRSDVVILGGGLGPTVDDVTRPAAARALGRELVYRPELYAQIEARFRAFGRIPTENNRQQAYIPDGAQPIENPVGTAPGFFVEHAGRLIFSLPGVPRELMHLLDSVVIPYLQTKLDLRDVIVVRTLHTIGEGESRIDALIADLEQSANPAIGLSAKQGQVDVRLTARAGSRDEAQAMLADMESRLRERIGKWIFGVDDETLEEIIAALLAHRRLTLATVELNTGGTISGRLTYNAAAQPLREAYRGGLVLSDADALHKTLDVDDDPAGQVAVVTRAAERVRKIHGTSLGLGVMLRNATPDGEPGVSMLIGLVSDDTAKTLERRYGGHTALAAQWAASLALGLLWRYLRAEHD